MVCQTSCIPTRVTTWKILFCTRHLKLLESKSCITAYHPQGDGMVKCFNHPLLWMFRSYVTNHAECKWYLLFILFTHHSAVHALTGVTPFEITFGHAPQQLPISETTAYNVTSYQSSLHSKVAQLTDFVKTHNRGNSQAKVVLWSACFTLFLQSWQCCVVNITHSWQTRS